MEEREILSAKISKPAVDGWKNFCAANGITVTAFLEVAGLELAEESHPPKVPQRIEMVERARQIDMERRSRKK